MKTTQFGAPAALALALAGASGMATAEITGVPAEAVLGPMVLAQPGTFQTYIGLYVPTTVGLDTVTELSAPHVLAGGPTTQTDFDPRIHWTLYDYKSKKVENGTCEVSPGDYVLWTTDRFVQDLQRQQRLGLAELNEDGIPSPECGPSTRRVAGYVVFQTYTGSDGVDADFAFWANGAIVAQPDSLGVPDTTIGTIPMLGMADGADPLPVGSGVPTISNSVISGGRYDDGIAADPLKYAPILAGIRMNNSDGIDDVVRIQAPIQGPLAGNGISIHAFWFDRNNANRVASTLLWDDHEANCSDDIPMPDELNLFIYNYPKEGRCDQPTDGSDTATVAEALKVCDENKGRHVVNPLNGYNSRYCLTDYWNSFGKRYPGSLGGYVEYELAEINSPLPTPGLVNSAAAAWNWQEARGQAAWASHMSTDLGKF